MAAVAFWDLPVSFFTVGEEAICHPSFLFFFLARQQKRRCSVAANPQTASRAQTLEFTQVGEAPGGLYHVPRLVVRVLSPDCNLRFWDI